MKGIVGGDSANVTILHKNLPLHMQPVLHQVAIKGKELDDAVKLLNKYEHVFVGSDCKVCRTNACDGHRINTATINRFHKASDEYTLLANRS